ncbi:MAG TPA: response regulator [Aestuariivirgaceae bacterium]|nr:response regulator [Aestuariivirgaceae bacterium]
MLPAGSETATTKKLRFLLIEDEALILLNLKSALKDLGWEVSGTAAKIDAAMKVARTGSFDAAIIDINLDGSMTYPVADILRERAIPFAFTTGYGRTAIDNAYSEIPILQKPFSHDQLKNVVSRLLPARAE